LPVVFLRFEFQFEFGDVAAESREFDFRLGGMAVEFSPIGAIGELMQDRFRVGSEPGDRPGQAAGHEREKTQALDRLRLRVFLLHRDFFRQDVDENDHDPRHEIGYIVERLALEERGVG